MDTPARRPVPDWLLLAIVCIGQFMVVLDVSIVNVALPSMQRDLHFTTTNLQWVVNAYALAFGGFLLLGGRAGDLFGRRRMFLVGLGLFTGASLLCAVAPNQQLLIGARALQGLGGAVLSPATLTILTTAFTEPRARSRALGLWSAMAAAGGAAGALLGGVLTDALSWRWIFLINLPVGLAALAAARMAVPESRGSRGARLDLAGALTVTGGLVALVYGVVESQSHGWVSAPTLGSLAAAAALLAAFAVLETRPGRNPIMPFRLFQSRALAAANVSMLLLGSAMFSMWLFLSLFLQDVLGHSPLQTGLDFLPQTLAIVIGAQISSRLVHRTGPQLPLVAGVGVAAAGLAWLSQLAAGQTYWTVAFGAGTLTTFGMGLAMTPLAFAATAGVAREDAGLASGVLNTSRQVGGSIGLAVLATVAASRTATLVGAHVPAPVAQASGYGRALAVAAVLALVGALAGLAVPRVRRAPETAVASAMPEGADQVSLATAVD